ncbi:Cytochrome b-c1 complex subunit 7 [Lobulomyces angularis]|nr:Cytochrome b-c1 complex subunit 7 [Lobulomyces angularis]
MASSLLNFTKRIASSPAAKKLSDMYTAQMGYRQIGLRLDDLIPEENVIVAEAVRRLPPREYQNRIFRFRRALNVNALQQELPPSEWTKPEEDVPYMRPIIHQIESEIETKENFENLTVIPPALKNRNRSS